MASANYKGIVDFAQAIDDTYVRKDAPSVPVGGAKGEVLRKKSNVDGDAEWANPLYHFNTLAEMQAALALGQIPDGANVSVEEEQPGGNTGDTSLDTTSENWVQNKVVAEAVNTISSDLASIRPVSLSWNFGYNDDASIKAALDAYTGNTNLGTSILNVNHSSGQKATYIVSNSGQYAKVIKLTYYGSNDHLVLYYRNGSAWSKIVIQGTVTPI